MAIDYQWIVKSFLPVGLLLSVVAFSLPHPLLAQEAGSAICPASAGGGVLCTGPEEVDPEPMAGQTSTEPANRDETGCLATQNEGVLCSGPEAPDSRVMLPSTRTGIVSDSRCPTPVNGGWVCTGPDEPANGTEDGSDALDLAVYLPSVRN